MAKNEDFLSLKDEEKIDQKLIADAIRESLNNLKRKRFSEEDLLDFVLKNFGFVSNYLKALESRGKIKFILPEKPGEFFDENKKMLTQILSKLQIKGGAYLFTTGGK